MFLYFTIFYGVLLVASSHLCVEEHSQDESLRHCATHQNNPELDDSLFDVEPLHLFEPVRLNISIETLGGVATIMIKKNMLLPTTKTKILSLPLDDENYVTINIYEGLGKMVEYNNLIDSFKLRCTTPTQHGILPAKCDLLDIEITCDVDNNGILVVTAREKSSNKSEMHIVSNLNRKTTLEQIEEVYKKYKEFEEALGLEVSSG
ncbi:hypothetical protein VCUG_02712 [Vavraia culicis subsp. floridensis]|uniref:SHSP domain-containing protein n=1 Tax=Vavraia culicis (isolate floridensis) TaxID=948595 RepID=L2GQ51_VAVCU|nr:uncharacterized protein VCUG_02712 [Vavraia culicis subsp. floridensis]ELA45801.1 hypothetical protein VCUG_02712 [Vavraia culicis subsp. floridensis]